MVSIKAKLKLKKLARSNATALKNAAIAAAIVPQPQPKRDATIKLQIPLEQQIRSHRASAIPLPPPLVRPLVQHNAHATAARIVVPQQPKLNFSAPLDPGHISRIHTRRMGMPLFRQPARNSRIQSRRRVRPLVRQPASYKDHGDISSLQAMLGLRTDAENIPNVTFLSLDLEFTSRSGITEIGISTLSTQDINGVPFGPYGNGWLEKMKHHHIVILPQYGNELVQKALFAESTMLGAIGARSMVRKIMDSLTPDRGSGHLVIVGQSVEGDIKMLHDNFALAIDVKNPAIDRLPFHSVIDTLDLATAAAKQGAHLPKRRLGSLAQAFGIDPKYYTTARDVFGKSGTVKGVHNASNDAAYALMTAMLMAVRWNDVVTRGAGAAQPWWKNDTSQARVIPARRVTVTDYEELLQHRRRTRRTNLRRRRERNFVAAVIPERWPWSHWLRTALRRVLFPESTPKSNSWRYRLLGLFLR